jgi:hypothetical protein
VSGALAERAFARKIEKAGFADVRIGERVAFDLARVASYPLFTEDVLDLIRRALPPERHRRVAVSVIATAARR